jgi:hypothetical protein
MRTGFSSTAEAPNCCSKSSPNGRRSPPSSTASKEPFSGWTKTVTDPSLCAAVVDRLTFNGQIIETGHSCRLAHARRAKASN